MLPQTIPVAPAEAPPQHPQPQGPRGSPDPKHEAAYDVAGPGGTSCREDFASRLSFTPMGFALSGRHS